MKLIIYSLLALTLCFCSPKPTVTIADLEWVIGTRSTPQENMLIYESWSKTNEKLLSGKSFFIENMDTTILETMELKIIDNEIFYCPKVVGQNDGEAVLFKLTSSDSTKLVFENAQHDFPKKICYYKEGNNINAWIEGNGKKLSFYLKRL